MAWTELIKIDDDHYTTQSKKCNTIINFNFKSNSPITITLSPQNQSNDNNTTVIHDKLCRSLITLMTSHKFILGFSEFSILRQKENCYQYDSPSFRIYLFTNYDDFANALLTELTKADDMNENMTMTIKLTLLKKDKLQMNVIERQQLGKIIQSLLPSLLEPNDQNKVSDEVLLTLLNRALEKSGVIPNFVENKKELIILLIKKIRYLHGKNEELESEVTGPLLPLLTQSNQFKDFDKVLLTTLLNKALGENISKFTNSNELIMLLIKQIQQKNEELKAQHINSRSSLTP